jgi:hypothetical protein
MTLPLFEVSPDGCGTAIFSPCRGYRYALTRRFNGLFNSRARVLLICGLNPSQAGATKDDQTIRKDRGFANMLGCDRLVKVNAFGWIETTSAKLGDATDPIGPDNDEVIRAMVRKIYDECADVVAVAAWGSHELMTAERVATLRALLPSPLKCFGTTRDGSPRHTSRLAYATPLSIWKA